MDRDHAIQRRLLETGRSINSDSARPVGKSGFHLLHSRTKSVAEIIEILSRNPEVQYVEPNFMIERTSTVTPSDTYFSGQWALSNTGQTIYGVVGSVGADMGAAQAWNITKGSNSIVVAVLDEGIDYSHPD